MNRPSLLAALLLLQLLLSACGMHRQLAPESALSAPYSAEGVDEEQVLPDNPYQLDRRPVAADAQRRFERALLALEQQDSASAMAQLLYLAEHYPRLSGPALNLALLSQQAGALEQAEHWFEQSIASNPANLSAYNQYGIFLREQGRFVEAEQVYLAALEVWEWHADTHRNIGVLYDLYMGERERALRHFYRYQALTGSDDRAVAGWIADLERQLTMLVQGD